MAEREPMTMKQVYRSPEERQAFAAANGALTEEQMAEIVETAKTQIGKQFTPLPLIESLAITPAVVEGWNEDVEKGAIKKWAIANRDFNPLWLDEEYAKNTKWEGLVAPPTFLGTISTGMGPLSAARVSGLWCGQDWEFFLPVRPGDHITVEAYVEDAQFKKGKMGPSTWGWSKSIFRNQRGEIVATMRLTMAFVKVSSMDAWKSQAGPVVTNK